MTGTTIAGFKLRASLLEEIFRKIIEFVQNNDNIERLDTYIFSPLLNHLFHKIFPYLVFAAILFILLFVMIAAVLGILITRGQPIYVAS